MNPITNHLYTCTTAQIGNFQLANDNVLHHPTNHTMEKQKFGNGDTTQHKEVSNIPNNQNRYRITPKTPKQLRDLPN